MKNSVHIGKSVQITGELTGSEDVTVDGCVEGMISITDHSLTIGADGRIKAEILAKSVIVVGEVVGNVRAFERVEVTDSGSVEGDITAPKVVLADGAQFRGKIDMSEPPAQSAPTERASEPARAPVRPAPSPQSSSESNAPARQNSGTKPQNDNRPAGREPQPTSSGSSNPKADRSGPR